mgnify:CR=1 FL=1
MSNADLTPTETRLALFTDQSPADCAASIATLADLLAEIRIDDSDHFGLCILHGVIRDSSIALSQRLNHAA